LKRIHFKPAAIKCLLSNMSAKWPSNNATETMPWHQPCFWRLPLALHQHQWKTVLERDYASNSGGWHGLGGICFPWGS
jgi:hypothetical protein